MSKHTAGPWKIGPFQSGSNAGVPIHSREIQVCLISTDNREMANEVERADARLIAAAPELLELAIKLRDSAVHPDAMDELQELAAKAIAKAEGREE